MIENGLIKEAKMVYKHKALNALKTVGYKELFEYLSGECTLDKAIDEIKKNTRRFAKRQITWFKKQENTTWFDYKEPYKNVLLHVKNKF